MTYASFPLPNSHHCYMHRKQTTNVENDYVNMLYHFTIIVIMTNIMNFIHVL